MSKVIKSKRTEKGIIIHEHDDGSSKQYLAVRGGLSWPIIAENLPGYFCIFGEELIPAALRRQNQRGKLIFVDEYEEPNILALNELYAKAFSFAIRYRCDTFYAVTQKFQGEDYSGYAKDFRKFIYEKQQEFMYEEQITVHLEEAPYADSPKDGLRYINDWDANALLELPEGRLVRNQLRMTEGEKIDRLPQTLNAVNALRFVVCGFNEYKPSLTSKNWRDKMRKGTWRSV
jgi:hypothetical protein